ncbi:MAG: S-adenosyl-L-homocysteine hydrolase [Sphingomonadaceae bacterium]|nr:S-adenosyl-L-homocysteine hydrolase [Sphingomonadaceae bacterium]
MHISRSLAGVAAAAMLIAATPAQAGQAELSAEKLRKLDIMLMVSALRCRHGQDDFQADYNRFAKRHLPAMSAAHRTLSAQYTGRFGASGGKRALDKLSVSMANRYGQGHPWMDCHELGAVTRDLADRAQGDRLDEAADLLLASHRAGTLVARYER